MIKVKRLFHRKTCGKAALSVEKSEICNVYKGFVGEKAVESVENQKMVKNISESVQLSET